MSCSRFEADLADSATGTLSPALAEHIDSCEACRMERRWNTAVRASLSALPSVKMPADLKRALLEEARKSKHGHAGTRWAFLRPTVVGWTTATAFAAAVFVLAVGQFTAADEDVPLSLMLEAHGQFERSLPLGGRESLLAGLEERP